MFVIDLSSTIIWLENFTFQVAYDFSTATSAYEVAWLLLFKYWGWLVIIYVFFVYFAYPEYMLYIQNRWFAKNIKMTFLAIDVPKMNEQSVQAMENFFDHLQGAHGTIALWDKYIKGEFQLSFSCEIVSIEGNVQFIVRTPSHWRNLVEAAVYSQFPDAEITEVEDYTKTVPRWYPNETHDMWGVEFTLSNKNVYLPIKTYPKFEHRFSEVFVDPMAAMLENMSQIGPGEQMWLQILLKPLEVGWGREGGQKEINKILKIPAAAPKKGLISGVTDLGAGLVSEFTTQLADVSLTGEGAGEKKEETQFRMMNLAPGQKEQLEAIEHKIAKLAFGCKIRYIYFFEKGKQNKAIGVNGMVGVIKQWTDMNLNGFKPDLKPTGTNSPRYILVNYRRNWRRNWLLGGYIGRDTLRGLPTKPLCSEELATMWHFPSMYVKAPLLKKTEFRKAAAPVDLPLGEVPAMVGSKELKEAIAEKTQVIPTFDYDSDEFEMQFAKDKEAFIKSRPDREKRLEEIAKEDAVRLEKIKKEEAKKKTEKSKSVSKKAGEVKEKKVAVEEKGEQGIPGNLPFID